MRNINPFYIQKALDSIAGKVKNASRLKNGTLLVEIFNENQADLLLKANLLGSHPIRVERHTSLNSSRRVAKTDSLDGMSDEEIQSTLADQCVSKAYRLIGREMVTHPLRPFLLTFETPFLPSTVHVGYERVAVRPYIPNPMRCFRCQRFWHIQQRCASSLVCGVCGENGNGEAPCSNPPHCVNCTGSHGSSDKSCPIYPTEKCIQELRVREGVSFHETRNMFLESRPKTGNQSSASALRSARGVYAASQTTETPTPRNPIHSRTPSHVTTSTQTEVASHTEDHSDTPPPPCLV
jgi:hypothetical protein